MIRLRNLRKRNVQGRNLLLVPVFALISACTAQSSGSYLSQSAGTYGSPARPLTICSGYGCPIKNKFSFSQIDRDILRDIMEPGKKSPEAERKALYKAIATMESMARTTLRYRPDIEFSYQKNSGKRGQMDCVDESLNTTAYLQYLHGQGLLRHHKPIRIFAERGLLIDGRYPHKSARMSEIGGIDWAVDSWKGKDGARPEIMPLSVWYRSTNEASNY